MNGRRGGDELAVLIKHSAELKLRGYLRSETIEPLPLRRLAAARPDTADAVFRKILRQRMPADVGAMRNSG